jgi:hypothetical protein
MPNITLSSCKFKKNSLFSMLYFLFWMGLMRLAANNAGMNREAPAYVIVIEGVWGFHRWISRREFG